MQHADIVIGGCVGQRDGWQRQDDGSKGESAAMGHEESSG
jgi:hypothetical protein